MQEIRCTKCSKIIGKIDWVKRILVLQCHHNSKENGKNKNCDFRNEITIK